jgi:hypothetical protein
MDSFESLISMLLRHNGYWTTLNFKVELTPEDKKKIRRPSCPRWDIDVLAYKGSTNEVLAVECKSYLDSHGVVFRAGHFSKTSRYKLFEDAVLRETVLDRLKVQLVKTHACGPDPTVTLGLAAGRIAGGSDRAALRAHFKDNGWRLFDPASIRRELKRASTRGYENDVAFVVSKLLLRRGKGRQK